jgi:putative ABC transport system permease protein
LQAADVRPLTQTLVLFQVSLTSLPQRMGSSLVIVLSMVCVTGVLLSMLSETEGLLRAYETGADPTHVVVLSAENPDEFGNGISREEAGTILDAPGIARGPDGRVAADPEVLFWIPPAGAYSIGSPELRGIGPAGLAVHPRFALLSGRLFRPGRHELMVGARAARGFGLKIGDRMILPSGEWPIVGVFADGGSMLEGQLLTDSDTVMSSSAISGFSSVLVRLVSPAAFGTFRDWLTRNPTLSVTAETQSDYAERTANRSGSFFTKVAYIIASIMTLGALFGTVKIMNQSVATRAREIATLRVLGYGSLPVAIATVLETALLSVAGALLGGALAWLLFDGRLIRGIDSAFSASVSPPLFALGLAWALGLALLGGLPPAIRAARLAVARALLAA